MDVLKFIDEELNRISHQLILKGGTAINLIYTNLARLSVDIDKVCLGYVIGAKNLALLQLCNQEI